MRAISQQDWSGPMRTGRRVFLGQAAAVASWPFSVFGAEAPPKPDREGPFPGLITRVKNPTNLEFPFPTLDSFITPNERFYVRNHFAAPTIDPRTWKLRVAGAVSRELSLSLADLRKLPSRTVTATMECAGNGRAFLDPKVKGVQWALGAVGNAEWTGVPLAAVLEKAGLADRAVEVVLEGTDRGEIKDQSPGVIPFARSLPLEKARHPEVLLAHAMNGKDLPRDHGFPLRVVVPGWYGMASVKWLTRVLVTDRPFDGFFQTFDYSFWTRTRGLPSLRPVTEMQVKALVARPALHEVVKAGESYRVHGAAWAGESEVARVEVSTDGGRSWKQAKLLDKPAPFCWSRWELAWQVPKAAGKHIIMARATDRRGRTQPGKRDTDRRTYMINHVLPIEFEVR
jgi:DMSO/TMAO reductase YedYZ molybdopterin-dependent catalytic subunit